MNRMDAIEHLQEFITEVDDSLHSYSAFNVELHKLADSLGEDQLNLQLENVQRMIKSETDVRGIVQLVYNDLSVSENDDLDDTEAEMYITTCDEYKKMKQTRIWIFDTFDILFGPNRTVN
jgi:hypothetical protein